VKKRGSFKQIPHRGRNSGNRNCLGLSTSFLEIGKVGRAVGRLGRFVLWGTGRCIPVQREEGAGKREGEPATSELSCCISRAPIPAGWFDGTFKNMRAFFLQCAPRLQRGHGTGEKKKIPKAAGGRPDHAVITGLSQHLSANGGGPRAFGLFHEGNEPEKNYR